MSNSASAEYFPTKFPQLIGLTVAQEAWILYVLNAVKAKELFQLGEERWHCLKKIHIGSILFYIYVLGISYVSLYVSYMHLMQIRRTCTVILLYTLKLYKLKSCQFELPSMKE